jgi:general secretion pathway protein A
MVGRFDLSFSSKHCQPTLTNKVALLQEAYDTLSDKDKRLIHDKQLQSRKMAPLGPALEKEEGGSPRITTKDKKKQPNIYRDYFGFSEKPFDLTPDPKYLYLSPKHKEVLAHLVFGLQENNGFLKIVGEVGTGKTMICRSFLRELHTDFNIAYIFNPCVNELELLQSINAELGLPSKSNRKKVLIDTLNQFLFEERKQGHRVVVIIDEAQDLEIAALEQLRLLSNLETETEKLIQIVLIGQPELNQLLERDELRQLGQRITIQWELLPLNLEETKGYIQHRLNVALGKGKINFTDSARQAIFKYSHGIPRMINVIADRALLIGYTENTKKITSRIIRQAIADIGRPPAKASTGLEKGWRMMISALVMAALMFFAVDRFVLPDLSGLVEAQKEKISALGQEPAQTEKNFLSSSENLPRVHVAAQLPEKAISSAPGPLVISAPDQLVTYLSSLTLIESKIEAAKWILQSWGIEKEELTDLDESDLNEMEVYFDLIPHELNANMNKLTTLNHPAILELILPNAQGTKYLALMSLKDGQGLFGSVDAIQMPMEVIDKIWSRKAFILWRDFENLPGKFEKGYQGREAIWLQKNLRLLGFFQGGEAPLYGVKTAEAVRKFQRQFNIRDDGRFYAESKIMLYNLLNIYPTPKLNKS